MALFPAVNAGSEAARAARAAEPWVEWLARLGYAAKGVVYILVGGLALRAALGSGGRTTGSEGALRTILQQPFGRVLLAIVALGLVGYALRRYVQALRDPEGIGTEAKGIAKRTGYFISGVIHTGLAIEAGRLAFGSAGGGSSGGDGDQGPRHWTAMVMEQPLGRWIIAAVGAGIVLFGLYEIYRAYRTKLGDRLSLSRLGPTSRRWIVRFGRLGMAARGVVFGLIGLFLIQAAWQYDPSEARGLEGALETLQRQPYGPWLLGIVAAGLVAYGFFEIVKARYRRIKAG